MFDYIQNIRSHRTVPCTTDILHTVMRSTIVGQTCAEIADCHEKMMRGGMSREDFETKKTELKKRLPAFCFHAHFKNGRRLNAEAEPSGLSILDIDHIKGSPEVFFNEKVKDRTSELGIVLVHKTPSGEGLRLVFVIPQGKRGYRAYRSYRSYRAYRSYRNYRHNSPRAFQTSFRLRPLP